MIKPTTRRRVITLLGGAAAWPLAAHAQQADRMRRIAVVMGVAEAARVGCEIVKVYKEHASAAPRAATSAGVRQAMS